MFTPLDTQHIAFFSQLLGEEYVITQSEALQPYTQDATQDLQAFPEVALKPKDTHEVSRIVRYCFEHTIPITPRGGGTGVSGGAVPLRGGVLLSLERMNQICHIDLENLQVTTEAGVITQDLNNALAKHNLYFPPDPASATQCFIGGNIATNAGGMRALKYGVTRDYVLNLEVVLPNGEVIRTGANTRKNATGYNLTQLFTGSEGTLGIITKIVLKVIYRPTFRQLLWASFSSVTQASQTVGKILQTGITPAVLEYMDRESVMTAQAYVQEYLLDNSRVYSPAYLLIELDGHYPEILSKEMHLIAAILNTMQAIDYEIVEDTSRQEALWSIRRKAGYALRQKTVCKELDTVVPFALLPVLVEGLKEIGQKYGLQTVTFGHAGDGNLHVHLLQNKLPVEVWKERKELATEAVFRLVVDLGGTLSAEHGVGYVHRGFMPLIFSAVHLDLFKQLKHTFDPKSIMNPRKIIQQ